jgi:hypothetical protein
VVPDESASARDGFPLGSVDALLQCRLQLRGTRLIQARVFLGRASYISELHRDSVVAEFASTAADGKTYQVEHFNLDDFLRLSERDILTHAGTVLHDDAVAKAELEYDRFASGRRALPALVEKQFDEAVGELKKLDKQRRTAPKPKSKTRSGTTKRPARKKR